MDSLKHECGVFGIVGDADAARLAYLGLHALQHRGQDGAGIVSRDEGRLYEHRGHGAVHEVFHESTMDALPGQAAIGHVRYATAGGNELANVQPFLVRWKEGQLAICHNGNLTNAEVLRDDLEAQGAIFGRTSDTEVIVHLLASSDQKTLVNRLVDALGRVEGAWCVLVLTGDKLVAARDPWGFRPLVLGQRGESFVVASETCALDFVQARFIREIEPGEMVILDGEGITSLRPFVRRPRRACIFEQVYFARPDSTLFGFDVYPARTRMGAMLARRFPVKADVVIAVPDSGVPAALGYAAEAGIPYEIGLLRSHHIGRTFIEPTQRIRDFGVRLKLQPNRSVVAGRRVVVVDDSIVRGTTSQKIVRMLRQAGAAEVHLRISSPPVTGPCHYGIDTPEQDELLAHRMDLPRIRQFLDADSIAYLSIEDLREAIGDDGSRYCDACFTGDYPIELNRREPSDQVPLFHADASGGRAGAARSRPTLV